MTWGSDGWQQPTSPNGILPTLRSVLAGALHATWTAAAVLDPGDAPVSLDGHGTGLPLSLLPVTSREWAGYFHRACKETLWPVLMSQPQRLRFDPEAWDQFRRVNARFADHIDSRAAPGATVWLHDYNLWLVPGRLRATRPDLRIGLFHHTPFPPPDVFAALPPAAEIKNSLRCLDWAGFHTESFAEHFRRALPGPTAPPRTGVHPLGIDWRSVEDITRGRAPRDRPHDGVVVLSVERLDYIKAPVQKVDTIEALLQRCPELRGHLRFRLVCPPPETGITAYDTTRTALERRIEQVNDAWGMPGWVPVEYVPRALGFVHVIDEYLAADIFWVTSLQDGMNLAAKEFITAHATAGSSGSLVLSRYAGAAEELGTAALLTDPHSPADLVDTLWKALTLTPAERRTQLRHLAGVIRHRNPAEWAEQIIKSIQVENVRGAGHGDRPAATARTTRGTGCNTSGRRGLGFPRPPRRL